MSEICWWVSSIISYLLNNIISIAGTLATSITAYLIWQQVKVANKQVAIGNKQVKIANEQTKELIEQNKFANDYSIYKESFGNIKPYFDEINSRYKQNNYMTYFYHQPISNADNNFYFDNKKDFLQDKKDFQEAIIKTKTLLDYLDSIVGYFHNLDRISKDNLNLILKPVSDYIFFSPEQKSEKNKNIAVSFLHYTFWCYDCKNENKEFSYPNLLKYFYNDSGDEKRQLVKECEESGALTMFINNSFYFLEKFLPYNYKESFLSEEKINFTNFFREYLENCNNHNNPNFLYFRFFIIEWSDIFYEFIKEIIYIKNYTSLKIIFNENDKDNFSSDYSTLELAKKVDNWKGNLSFLSDDYIENLSFLSDKDKETLSFLSDKDKETLSFLSDKDKETLSFLSDKDKENLSSLLDNDKNTLKNHYELYHNFDKAIELYKNLDKNQLVLSENLDSYDNVLLDFPHTFAYNFRVIHGNSTIVSNLNAILNIFKPFYSDYFKKLYQDHLLIIKILEECELYHDLAREAKQKENQTL